MDLALLFKTTAIFNNNSYQNCCKKSTAARIDLDLNNNILSSAAVCEMFYRTDINVLVKLPRKHLQRSPNFCKIAGLKIEPHLKCFTINFTNIFGVTFLQNTSGRLLLLHPHGFCLARFFTIANTSEHSS